MSQTGGAGAPPHAVDALWGSTVDVVALLHGFSVWLAAALLALVAFATLAARVADVRVPLGFVALGFVGLVVEAAASGYVTPLHGAIIVLTGGGALVALRELLSTLKDGRGLELHRLGGFGGDPVGWRLSPAATLALIAAALFGATLFAATDPAGPTPGRQPGATPAVGAQQAP